MNRTSIPWVLGPDGKSGFTWNPFAGCSHASKGCAHCYAERLAGTRLAHLPQYAGLVSRTREVETRIRKVRGRNRGATAHMQGSLKLVESVGHWTGEVRFFPEKLSDPLRRRTPSGIFVGDMGDLFHDGLTNEQIAAVFGVMAACPQHRFYVLTKRPTRMRAWFAWVEAEVKRRLEEVKGSPLDDKKLEAQDHVVQVALRHDEFKSALPVRAGLKWMAWPKVWPLPNVWLGATIENGDAQRARALALAEIPASVHFWSCEPLLEHIDVLCPRCGGSPNDHRAGDGGGCSGDFPDWVIVGGESGSHARPCRVEWIRSIVQQCREAGVPVFSKQLGANVVEREPSNWPNGFPGPGTTRLEGDGFGNYHVYGLRDRAGADPAEWPEDLRVRQMPTVNR